MLVSLKFSISIDWNNLDWKWWLDCCKWAQKQLQSMHCNLHLMLPCHAVGAWQKKCFPFEQHGHAYEENGVTCMISLQRAIYLMKTPFQLTCKLLRIFNAFTCKVWLLWSFRSRNIFTLRKVLENFMFLCFAKKDKI